MKKSGKLSEVCQICGKQATHAIADLWCERGKSGWLSYDVGAKVFRCDKHNRDSIIRTRDEEVFTVLSKHRESAILVESE